MGARIPHWLADHRFPLLAAAIILVAAGLRVALIAAGWPGTDSDEATMGIMAKHILSHGEHPIFFYGQPYMGSIEAYLGAMMFLILGVSLFALKCGLVVLFAAFMVVMYVLLSLLFSRGWALAGLAIVGLGSDTMLYHELSAWGGYLETILFGALMTLIAVRLVRGADRTVKKRWRCASFGAWGLTAGLAVWSDPLAAPFVAFSALFLVVTLWHEIRGWCGVAATVALVIGLSPWLIYIATSPSPQAAASFLRNAPAIPTSTTTALLPTLGAAVEQHVLGTVVIAIPNDTGGSAFCPALSARDAWPPSRWTTPGRQGCMALRGLWGAGFIALLLATIICEIRAFWSLWWRHPTEWRPDERRRLARGGGRLVALLAPATTTLLFAISSASVISPWNYGRYLISTLIALPVMVGAVREHAAAQPRSLPLTGGMEKRPGGDSPRRVVVIVLKTVLPIFLVALLASGFFFTFEDIPAQQTQNYQQVAMIDLLIQQGDTRIFSDYWSCMRIMFQSNERIICSILNVHNGRFLWTASRYPPYDAIVAAASHRAYVFPIGSIQAATFPALAAQAGWHLTQSIFAGQYVIYDTVGTPPSPYPIPTR